MRAIVIRDFYSKTNTFILDGKKAQHLIHVARVKKEEKVQVLDGDGNILMNLGSLVTIGSLKPKNLVHIVFDNNSHESTGNQPTNSSQINLAKIAKTVNYKIFVVQSKTRLSGW